MIELAAVQRIFDRLTQDPFKFLLLPGLFASKERSYVFRKMLLMDKVKFQ